MRDIWIAVEAALETILRRPEASHPLVREAIIDPLLDNLEQIQDYFSEGSMKLADCADLAEKLQEVSGSWSLLRWLTLEGVIEDIGALQEES